jgi:murein DD-endopeptidase MepM/ murein hydrolase activator NlpD
LLNASVGVQRFLARVRPDKSHRSAAAASFQHRSLALVVASRTLRANLRALRAPRTAPRPTLSGERLVSVTAVGLMAIALVVSNFGTTAAAGAVGNANGAGSEPRIAVGGAVSGIEDAPQSGADQVDGNVKALEPDGLTSVSANLAADAGATIDGPFNTDGTLLKPVSVDTTVADGKALLRTYRVRSGDTLTGIARKYHVSMMTLWWANHLTSKDALHVGQSLTIPPVSGVVVSVGVADTLDSLASKFGVDALDIVDANGLQDTNLIVGQTLTIPGGLGAGIATPKPTKAPVVTRHISSGGTVRQPAQYRGGRLLWPVPGGYISQYFHYGHYALDIAAPYGSRIIAAAAGTVIFAGWKSNGGGYQVWISHGSNLYTGYYHMSSITVGRGQSVARGQQVGRIGMTGDATGPHCHFEVWIGPMWSGGTRVNPLAYL